MIHQPSLRLLSCAFATVLWCASSAHAIVNGTYTSSFSAVGELGSASGVLIADNWVLTAAHVANALTLGASSFDSLGGASLIDAVYTFLSAAFPNNDIERARTIDPGTVRLGRIGHFGLQDWTFWTKWLK